MFLEEIDLYGTLDLKSNPVDSSHIENNFKRTINFPTTRDNTNEPITRNRAVEPDSKQFCIHGSSRSKKCFGWLEPELEFGFRLHRNSLWGKRVVQIMQMFYSAFWTKLVWSRSQKLQEIGTGAKKFWYPELEPEIWVLAPMSLAGNGEDLLAL